MSSLGNQFSPPGSMGGRTEFYMKKVFTILASLVLGAMLAAPAFAAEAAEPMLISPAPDLSVLTAPEKEFYPVIKGFDYAPVKSSLSDASGAIDYFFDGSLKTMCGMDMTGLPYRTVSIYMTSYGPFTMSAMAASILSSEEDLSIQVRIYGTNDSLLEEWTEVKLSSEVTSMEDYLIFTNVDYEKGPRQPADPEKYQFYRIDLTLLEGNSFALAELVFFRPKGPLMVPVYDATNGVEVGEEPIGYEEYNPNPTVEAPVVEEEEPEVNLGSKPFIRRVSPTPKPASHSK